MCSLFRKLPMYIVDAFTKQPFAGNAAAVCLVAHKDFPEELFQRIATEMNLSETVFIISQNDSAADSGAEPFRFQSRFSLRWFSPTNEVPLCGHATLASAAVLFQKLENRSPSIVFDSASGPLIAFREGSGDDIEIRLDFPLNVPRPMEMDESLRELLHEILGADHGKLVQTVQLCSTTRKLLVRMVDSFSRADLEALPIPNGDRLLQIEHSGRIKGVMITVRAKEPEYDFYSRYFTPWNGILEDPVTGSAHTVLGGYWSSQLGKTELRARQCSKRGGDLRVRVRADGRVDLIGHATIVMHGTLYPPATCQ